MEFENYKIIKKILNQGCNVVYKLNLDIESYKNVINVWKIYKYNNFLPFMEKDNSVIKDVFDFHKTNINHVILVFSRNNENCLLMSKISGKYINLLIPAVEINRDQKSFAAVYC